MLAGLASTLLEDHPDFALKRDRNRKTALHLLAQKPKPSSYPRGSPGICASFKRCEFTIYKVSCLLILLVSIRCLNDFKFV